jgi:cell division protein FtsN
MEEHYLDSDKGQSTIATSIFRAFKEYKVDMESGAGDEHESHSSTNDTPVQESPKATNTSANQSIVKSDDAPARTSDNSDTTSKENTKPVPAKEGISQTASPTPKKEKVKPEPKPSHTADNTPPKPKPTTEKAEAKEDAEPGVFFTVQIGATTNPEKDKGKFGKIASVKALKGNDGFTRFVVGHYSTAALARQKQTEMKQSGFKDAFLSAYDGDKKITVPEAEQLLKRK